MILAQLVFNEKVDNVFYYFKKNKKSYAYIELELGS